MINLLLFFWKKSIDKNFKLINSLIKKPNGSFCEHQYCSSNATEEKQCSKITLQVPH